MRVARCWLMLWSTWLVACAGPSALMESPASPLGGGRPLMASAENGAGWDGSPVPRETPSGPLLGQVTPRQREAECQLAIRHGWGVLAPIREVGAKVELTWWANQGALTLVSIERTAPGGDLGDEADEHTLGHSLSRSLSTFVGTGPRYVHATFERDRSRWELRGLRFTASAGVAPPPEAKTFPVDVPEIAAGPFRALETAARTKWLLMRVPEHGAASFDVTVVLEDDRVVGSHPGEYHALGNGDLVAAPPGFATVVASYVVPFTQGLGRRSVTVTIQTSRSPSDPAPRWHVQKVATVRPMSPEPEEDATVAEYRRIHEEIMRRWHEELADAAVMAVTFTTEQVAVWIVGGWVARGVGGMLEMASGPVLRVLGRGGPEATDWLYCLLRRLPQTEYEALVQLWEKAETEGLEALSAAEKARLRTGFQRLEELATTPLDSEEKALFRRIAPRRLWPSLQEIDPTIPKRLVYKGNLYPVHHRYVLEYAHLLPEVDVNAPSRLVAVHPLVHTSMGRVWTTLRLSRMEVTAATVQEVVGIVDRQYGRWYNVSFDESIQQPQLQAAEKAAMAEIRALIIRMGVH